MLTTRALTAALALFAAAAVTVACSPPAVGGNPVAGDQPGTRPTEELKSTRVPAATAPAAPVVVYEDVSGRGSLSWDRAEPFATVYSEVPEPGAAIFTGADDMCSLGATLITSGERSAAATAGHCRHPSSGDPMQYLNASPVQDLIPLSPIAAAEHDGGAIDSGYIIAPGAPATRLADTWPVAGVLNRDGIETLPSGTPVCLLGAVSGVQCGPVWGIDSFGTLRFDAVAREGDSGAAVFVVNRDTRVATLVGLLSAIGDDPSSPTAFATLLDPALERMQVTAAVDQAAAATVAGLSGYSTRTTIVR